MAVCWVYGPSLVRNTDQAFQQEPGRAWVRFQKAPVAPVSK